MARNKKALDARVGTVVGNFKILRKEYRSKSLVWICLCVCGKEKTFWKFSAINRQKTCGCGTDDAGLSEKQRRSMLSRMHSYKSGARKRNFEWNLTYKEFVSIATQNCFYCGSAPKKWDCVSNAPSVRKDCPNINPDQYAILFNGVDRLDSKAGYNIKNTVSCCTKCNRAKSDMTTEEFKLHIERIYKWLFQNV